MIEIIPAIDLINGKCVRLAQGDFSRMTIYNEDPVETAQSFEAAGVKRLHIVDLDGAKTGRVTNLSVLKQIARSTGLEIDFGGGIKTDDDVEMVFDAGARMVNIGSAAVKTPERFFGWLEKYGGERVLLGADVREGKIAISGWQTETDLEIVAYLRDAFGKGLLQAFVTDIAKDGLLLGPAIELYTRIREALPELELIASGGVNTLDDVSDLGKIGCNGVIIGKAIYEGKIDLAELVNAQC